MSRATTSVGPAAANGTMILTGRSGYPGVCASAALAKRSPVQAASTRAITLLTLMGVPPAVVRHYGGRAFTSLSRDGKEVDGGDKPGYNLDSTHPPLSERLTNGRAECKRFQARPNVQTRRRSAPTPSVRRQPCPRISAATAMGFAAIVTEARLPASEIRPAANGGPAGSARSPWS